MSPNIAQNNDNGINPPLGSSRNSAVRGSDSRVSGTSDRGDVIPPEISRFSPVSCL